MWGALTHPHPENRPMAGAALQLAHPTGVHPAPRPPAQAGRGCQRLACRHCVRQRGQGSRSGGGGGGAHLARRRPLGGVSAPRPSLRGVGGQDAAGEQGLPASVPLANPLMCRLLLATTLYCCCCLRAGSQPLTIACSCAGTHSTTSASARSSSSSPCTWTMYMPAATPTVPETSTSLKVVPAETRCTILATTAPRAQVSGFGGATHSAVVARGLLRGCAPGEPENRDASATGANAPPERQRASRNVSPAERAAFLTLRQRAAENLPWASQLDTGRIPGPSAPMRSPRLAAPGRVPARLCWATGSFAPACPVPHGRRPQPPTAAAMPWARAARQHLPACTGMVLRQRLAPAASGRCSQQHAPPPAGRQGL
jgi:hypothetical protein